MKLLRYRKNTITLLLAVLFSTIPFMLLLAKREYDLSQTVFPQKFQRDELTTVDLSESVLEQSFRSETDGLVGFDIVVSDCSVLEEMILVDQEGQLLRKVSHSQNVFTNKCQKQNYRFDKINDSKGKTYIIKIDSDQEAEIKYSTYDTFKHGSLKINGQKVQGDINFVPVYKEENVFRYLKVLGSRMTYFFFF